MVRYKWQRMLTLLALLLATLFPVGTALAAPAAVQAHSGDFISCLQTTKEDLGTVLPGSAFSDRISECPLSGVADLGPIPLTGDVNASVWRDAGASVGVAITPAAQVSECQLRGWPLAVCR